MLENGYGNKLYYTVVVSRADNNAVTPTILTDLKVAQTAYALSPRFASATRYYEVTVESDTEYINLIPTSASHVYVNNYLVASGTASQNLTLKSGANFVDVTVVGLDNEGNETEGRSHYIVKINKPNTDTSLALSELVINRGTIAPTVAPGVTDYFVTVPYDVSALTLTAAASLDGAIVKVSGGGLSNAVTNATTPLTIPTLAAGSDTLIRIEVYENNLASVAGKSYTLTVTRKGFTTKLADLADLAAAEGEFTTEFRPREMNYYLYVPNDTASVTLTGAAADGNATVEGLGTVTLNTEGAVTTQTVLVKNGDNQQAYSVTIIREAAAPADLTLNAAITPAGQTAQNVTLDSTNRTATAAFTADAASFEYVLTADNLPDGTLIIVNGRTYQPGETVTVAMDADVERLDIRVIAGDSAEAYVLYVTGSADPHGPYLSKLMLDTTSTPSGLNGSFTTTFDPQTFEYEATVSAADIWLFAETANTDAVIEMFDPDCNDYAIVTLPTYIAETVPSTLAGDYRFRVTEFSADGYENVNDYLLHVYQTDDPIISDIRVSNAMMTTPFSPPVRSYDVKISETAEEFSVTAEVSYEANTVLTMTLTYTDSASTPHTMQYTSTDKTFTQEFQNLPTDVTNFTVTVELEVDGIATDGSYTLNVVRSDEAILEAFLSSLTAADLDGNAYDVTPTFDRLTAKYETKINYTDNSFLLNVAAEEADSTITVKVGDSGTPFAVTGGVDTRIDLPAEFLLADDATETVYITVTAADGKTGTYELKVGRGERPAGDSRLVGLTTTPAYTENGGNFLPETFDYTINLSPLDDEVTILATANSGYTVTITYLSETTADVNGTATTFPIDTTTRHHVFFVTVEGGGKAPCTYVITASRVNSLTLADLSVVDTNTEDAYEILTPAFDPDTVEYDVLIDPLDDDLTFNMAAAAVDGDSGYTFTIYIDGDKVYERTVTDVDTATSRYLADYTAELVLAKPEYEVNIYITDAADPTKVGYYTVKVKRDTTATADDAKVQTHLVGKVNVLDTNNNSGFTSLTLTKHGGEGGDTTYPVQTLPASGEFDISLTDEGIYSLLITRPGYLSYEITNIVVTETLIEAQYNFGDITLFAGDVDEDGDIDNDDVLKFKELMTAPAPPVADTTDVADMSVGTPDADDEQDPAAADDSDAVADETDENNVTDDEVTDTDVTDAEAADTEVTDTEADDTEAAAAPEETAELPVITLDAADVMQTDDFALTVGLALMTMDETENTEETETAESTADEPAVDEPAADEPAADEPTTDEPAADEPATDEPAADEPATEEPAADEPATDEPAADEPAVDEPATDEPAADEPATDEPATDEPVADEPATDVPEPNEPELNEPVQPEPEPVKPEEPINIDDMISLFAVTNANNIICDFNGDGRVDARDLQTLMRNRTKVNVSVDNVTGPNPVPLTRYGS